MALLSRLRAAADVDSVLSADKAVGLASDLLGQWRLERDRLDRIDQYLHGQHDAPYTPREAQQEYKLLARRAVTNLCPLITKETGQALRADGYRRSDQPDNAAPWRWWQANGLDARQLALHDSALSYGHAYNVVLPGVDTFGVSTPMIRGLSPRVMYAAYADPAWDDWPMAAIRVEGDRNGQTVKLYDESAVYHLRGDAHGQGLELVSYDLHGMQLCPVVKFADMPDLEGRVTGEVEPYIVMQDRINQDVFDRLLTQTYSSFKVRTATGIAVEKDSDGKPVKPIEVERNRLLVAKGENAKFGSLDESPIGPFLESEEQDVRRLASVSQTPPTSLNGQISNLSAESLVIAIRGGDNKADDRKLVYGEAHEQTLRAAAFAFGDMEGAQDVSAELQWKDMGARALGALADAYTKLASDEGLGIPREILWEKLPFMSQTDVERAKVMKKEADELGRVLERLGADLDGGN